jgi:3'-phosphoadenosine 5'-phosphosulfate sulfotransferase (PAPS reductase)/FAD synthetase
MFQRRTYRFKLKPDKKMDEHQILKTLIELLEANRIRIRKEVLENSPGGLCRIGKESILFLDSRALPEDQAEACAAALAEVVDLDNIYLLPEVREFVENRTRT